MAGYQSPPLFAHGFLLLSLIFYTFLLVFNNSNYISSACRNSAVHSKYIRPQMYQECRPALFYFIFIAQKPCFLEVCTRMQFTLYGPVDTRGTSAHGKQKTLGIDSPSGRSQNIAGVQLPCTAVVG